MKHGWLWIDNNGLSNSFVHYPVIKSACKQLGISSVEAEQPGRTGIPLPMNSLMSDDWSAFSLMAMIKALDLISRYFDKFSCHTLLIKKPIIINSSFLDIKGF